MARKKIERCCRKLKDDICYTQIGSDNTTPVDIALDEFEALRLCDFEDKSQIEAAKCMKISRGTLQRVLKSARKKLIGALLNGKCIRINKK